jgi:hypothetical protein
MISIPDSAGADCRGPDGGSLYGSICMSLTAPPASERARTHRDLAFGLRASATSRTSRPSGKIPPRHAIHLQRRRGQFRNCLSGLVRGPRDAHHFKVLLDDRDVLTEQMYFPDAVNNLSMRTFPPMQGRLNSRAVVNANDRFANFHDPKRLSFGAIKEEHDCYAVSLVLGVDRFAVAQADRRQPAVERPRLLIPASP